MSASKLIYTASSMSFDIKYVTDLFSTFSLHVNLILDKEYCNPLKTI